jgi:hypothetical protein
VEEPGTGRGSAPGPRDAVDSQEIAILGEDNVLFDVVIAEYGAEVFKMICLAYAIGEASGLGRGRTGADEAQEECARDLR